MEDKFVEVWLQKRAEAMRIGVRLRPLEPENAMMQAHRCLSGHRTSDGFGILADKHRLDLSLEALAVDKRFTSLFSDVEANTALNRLLAADYRF